MGRFIRIGLVIFLLAGPCSCFRISYKFAIDTGKTHRSEYWNHYFVMGLMPVKARYSFEDLCLGGAPVRADSHIAGANILSALLSFSLNSGSTVGVQCLAKKP